MVFTSALKGLLKQQSYTSSSSVSTTTFHREHLEANTEAKMGCWYNFTKQIYD